MSAAQLSDSPSHSKVRLAPILLMAAAIVCVFLLAAAAQFVIGCLSGGFDVGVQLASSVVYYWLFYLSVGIFVGSVCVAVLLWRFSRRRS